MLKELKSNTAPGITGISYVLIKAASNQAQELFRKFAGKCIQEGKVPRKWKISQIYPIPKESDWKYDLNNVRPIALLETFRKCTTKILTKRLTHVICKRNILKGPNFAGLPGNSTEEPVHIINAIMEDAKEKGQELWLVFQDMKKAFDSVSLESLDLALKRIKFPQKVITFIMELFGNRQSKIITDLGLTDTFMITDGIEQGEVLSPLVWRIFYDPLLERIQEDPELGYKVSAEYVYNPSLNWTKKEGWRQAVVAYADDTTWIANSKDQMKKIIKIAEEFFQMNDIQINGKKSKLLTMNTQERKEERRIFYGGEWIPEEDDSKITRFLGIWLNKKLKESAVKAKAKEIVRSTIRGLKTKKMTISQLSYINNMCIIPKLCYMLQVSKLSKGVIDSIHNPIIGLAKNKMEMQRSTRNSIVEHKGLGNCKALWKELLLKQITSLHARLNSSGPEEILTRLRIDKGTQLIGCDKDNWHIDPPDICAKLWRNNLACITMWRAKELHLTFRFDPSRTSPQANKESFAKLLKNNFSLNIARALQKINLVTYMQLINQQGDKMITWQQLKILRNGSGKGRPARWFKEVEKVMIEDMSSRTLKAEFQLITKNTWALKTCLNPFPEDNRRRDWILVYNQELKTKPKETIGKVKENKGSKILTEHWKNETIPNTKEKILKKCEGCILNQEEKESCLKWYNKENIQGILTSFVKKSEERKLEIEEEMIEISKTEIVHENLIGESPVLEVVESSIEISLINKQRISKKLKEFLIKKLEDNQQEEEKRMIFYTDGSLKKSSISVENQDRMGASWIQVDLNEEKIQDEGYVSTENWPSSTKAELLAIWCVLLITPIKKEVKIYTDSEAAICSIKKGKVELRNKQWLRQKNYNLIKSIADILRIKQISLDLVKIKGHSSNRWNDKADSLAKKGASELDLERLIIDPPLGANVALYWKEYQVENPTREFTKSILDLKNGADWRQSTAIQGLETAEDICKYRWSLLWDRIKNQNGIHCSSMLKNKRLCILVKCLQEKLPVLGLLAKRRPDLYESSLCTQCKENKEENQNHLASCRAYEKSWINTEVLASSAAWLSLTPDTRSKVTRNQLRDCLWGKLWTEKIERRQEAIKGLVREETWCKLRELVPSIQEAKDLIKTAMNIYWNSFFENIWKKRCAAMIEWERNVGIEQKKKRSKQESQIANRINTVTRSSSDRVKLISKLERKRVKEEEKTEIEKRWVIAVEKLIKKSWRPFWDGSSC
jgi:ribonuclease HI